MRKGARGDMWVEGRYVRFRPEGRGGVAFRVTTTVGTERTYYWSYGPRSTSESRRASSTTTASSIQGRSRKTSPTRESRSPRSTISRSRSRRCRATCCSRGNSIGCEFTRADRGVQGLPRALLEHGRRRGNDADSRSHLPRIINETRAFRSGAIDDDHRGSPLAEPLQRQSPPFDVDGCSTRDDNLLVPGSTSAKVFPIFGGRRRHGRYRGDLHSLEGWRGSAMDGHRHAELEARARVSTRRFGFREPGDEDHRMAPATRGRSAATTSTPTT